MTYDVWTEHFRLGTIVATNAKQAITLARNKFPQLEREGFSVEPQEPEVDMSNVPRGTNRFYKIFAVSFIALIAFLGGMRFEHDRLINLPAPAPEAKVEVVKPSAIQTNIGKLSSVTPLENHEWKLVTEQSILYVDAEFPVIWTSQCHIVNYGGHVWFTEDGLPNMYNITRQ